MRFPDRLKSNFLSHQNTAPLSFRQFKSMVLLKSKHCPYFMWAGGLTLCRQCSAPPSTWMLHVGCLELAGKVTALVWCCRETLVLLPVGKVHSGAALCLFCTWGWLTDVFFTVWAYLPVNTDPWIILVLVWKEMRLSCSCFFYPSWHFSI